MRIDHIAFRVQDRFKTAKFFREALGYDFCPRVGDQGFRVDFDDGTWADCLVLRPSERASVPLPWSVISPLGPMGERIDRSQEYHTPPEVFISEGSPGSIVDKWVKAHGGNNLHHIALQVDSIEETKKQWETAGYANFASPDVLVCPGLRQIFTDPSELTGVVWELIEREPGDDGFCKKNVRDLMLSTDKKKINT